MNSYFYRLFLPFTVLAGYGLVLTVLDPSLLWWTLGFWLSIGFLGSGVGFHRLFSHRVFETYKPIEYTLAVLGTLAGYGPLLYWCGNHTLHHMYTDTEKDPTSPIHGFWHSALTWNLKRTCETQYHIKNRNCMRIMRDPFLMWLSKHFIVLNWICLILVGVLLGYKIALAGYVLATWAEKFRVGFITSYLLHLPSNRLSYRSHETKDWSRNSVWLLPLAWGFAFHNNHHARPGSANDGRQWFEIDPEYLVIKLIRRRKAK